MSNLESPPPSPAHLPPDKLPENENLEPIINRAVCTSSSTDHKPDDGHSRIMENFKGMIFKFAISSSPTKSLSPMQMSLIEKHLDEVFPSFRTPVHPPYSAMIESAINELGEEGGSSEESISQFIRKEYLDLPWAHDALLKHHLGNLCEDGSIIKTYNGLYMFQKVVTNQDSSPARSPSYSVDAYSRLSLSPDCSPSSNSWTDSSSSPRPKRKRQMYTRRSKKQGGRRWSNKNKKSNRRKAECTGSARVSKRRRRRPLKKYVSEDETEASDDLLMLELMREEAEDDRESEEECSEGEERIEEVSGKRQRIMKQGQRQETGLVFEIQMDNHEDMVDEGQREVKNGGAKGRKAHLRPRYTPRRRRRSCKKILSVVKTQPRMEEIESDVQYPEKAEVSEEKYKIDKELDDAVKSHNQVRGNTHGTLESSQAEDICAMSDIGKSKSVREVKKLKPCNFVMEVVPEKDESVKECDKQKLHVNIEGIEENNAVLGQEHSIGRKRRGRPLKKSVKQRKVEVNPKQIPGRSRGRPQKKDLSIEKAQQKEQIQDPILEEIAEVPLQKCDTSKKLIEVAAEHNQSQGNLCETLERSSSWEIKMAKEIEKSKEEEKKIREQFNLGMEGVPENDEAAKGCDGQKELKKCIGSEEEAQSKEPNLGLKQNQSNQRKEKGKLLSKGTKCREVHKMYSRVPGRSRGMPCEKDILVGRTETKAEQAETTGTHELKFKENTEVHKENCAINKGSTKEVEKCDELERNMHGTLEWSLVDKTNFVKEVRKPGSDAEENIEIKMDCCMMEGQQQNGGVKEFKEQKEPENAFDDEKNQSSKETNVEEDHQKRQETEMQNQQLEEGLKDCCILEGEEQQGCGVKGFNGLKEPGDAFNEEQDHYSKEKNEMPVEKNQPWREENEVQSQQTQEGFKYCCMTEGEQQQYCNVKGSNMQKEAGNSFGGSNMQLEEDLKDCCILEVEGQQGCGVKEFNGLKEAGEAFDVEQDYSSDKNRKMPVSENQLRREENEEKIQQTKECLEDCCMTEGDQQQDCNVKGWDMQGEVGNSINEEENQFSEEKNETTFEENRPKRLENEEQNQQQEDGLKSITEYETEVPQIQANIQSSGQYKSIIKAIGFPDQSSGSVLRRCKKNLNSSMEELKQMAGEDKVLETDCRQTEVLEQTPASSTADNAQLKSIGRSSHSQISKFNDLCCIL